MPERTFFLKPRPPLRAFLIAAVLSLIGGVFAVLALQAGWHAIVITLAILVLACGILLLAAGVVAMSRLGVQVRIDDEGYEITGTGQRHEGKWADVTKVTQAVEAAHITIYHGDVRRTHVIFPGGPAQDQMQDIIDEIVERLQRVKR